MRDKKNSLDKKKKKNFFHSSNPFSNNILCINVTNDKTYAFHTQIQSFFIDNKNQHHPFPEMIH